MQKKESLKTYESPVGIQKKKILKFVHKVCCALQAFYIVHVLLACALTCTA